MKLVLDIETTFTKIGSKTNPSPYLPTNKLVSVGTIAMPVNGLTNSTYLFFNHKERQDAGAHSIIQEQLNNTSVIIGHNLKFDMSWLYECGFTYSGELWDTMVFEYILAKGQKPSLSLKDCAIKHGLTPKKDILADYIVKGLNVDEIPAQELEEYGRADIQTTIELYKHQQELITNSAEVQSMLPAIELSMKVLPVLISMERNGISIDKEALSEVEASYKEEAARLEHTMKNMVTEVMGHRPINLNSSEHLSWVVYSRKVKDKKQWADIFNIGAEERGAVKKAKYARFYPKTKFKSLVMQNMETLYRQDASQCDACYGKGKILKTKADGSFYKKENICKCCNGTGFIYTNTDKIAGFKVQPIDSTYASMGGFATDKTTIDTLLQVNIPQKAKEFLECLKRYNAIQTYLSTFVEGIFKNTMEDGLLHTSLNQCITATGRLSSSAPNFQNLPRGNTFPVRKAIKSRFKDGVVLDADWSGLEFRTAVALSKDLQGKQDIDSGADVHQFTADTLTQAGEPTDRQSAKAHTFKPLFAGMSGTDAQIEYYKAFNKKYYQIHAWQEYLVEQAILNKQIQSPSGRIYAFPNARRISKDKVIGKTQIYNYIIQGFATGDLMPLALVHLHKALMCANLRAVMVLTVHDSVLIDCPPEEKEEVVTLVKFVFGSIKEYLKQQFNFEAIVDFAFEIKVGKNWLEMEKL